MARSTGRDPVSDTDRAYRGRRITWEEFFVLTGRTPPVVANDNTQAGEERDAA